VDYCKGLCGAGSSVNIPQSPRATVGPLFVPAFRPIIGPTVMVVPLLVSLSSLWSTLLTLPKSQYCP